MRSPRKHGPGKRMVSYRMTAGLIAASVLPVGGCGFENASSGEQADRITTRTGADSGPQDVRILSIMSKQDADAVRLGTLAQRRGRSDDAKELGAMLMKDHAAHRAEVEALATQMGLSLWSDEQIERDHERAAAPAVDPVATLEAVEDSRFDRELGRVTLDMHRALIATLEHAWPDIGNNRVRALTDRTIATLKRHADTARTLASR